MFPEQDRTFAPDPARVLPESAVATQHPMAGDEQGNGVGPDRGADGTRCTRHVQGAGQFADLTLR